MSETIKKRAWFQIHLSTAVVLMFVAGGLMWVNSVKYFDETRSYHQLGCRGWPLTMWWSDRTLFTNNCYEGGPDFDSVVSSPMFSVKAALFNTFVIVLMLLVIGVVCEFWLRRKGRKKST